MVFKSIFSILVSVKLKKGFEKSFNSPFHCNFLRTDFARCASNNFLLPVFDLLVCVRAL